MSSRFSRRAAAVRGRSKVRPAASSSERVPSQRARPPPTPGLGPNGTAGTAEPAAKGFRGGTSIRVGKGRCRGATLEISQTRQCLVSRQTNLGVLKGRWISPVPSGRFHFYHQYPARCAGLISSVAPRPPKGALRILPTINRPDPGRFRARVGFRERWARCAHGPGGWCGGHQCLCAAGVAPLCRRIVWR